MKIFLPLSFLLLITSMLYAQDKIDAFDVARKMLHLPPAKHHELEDSSQFSKQAVVTLIPGIAYSQLKGLAAAVEGNISFKRSAVSRVSVIKVLPEITFRGYLIPRSSSSIWFRNNTFNLSTDWRFYHFYSQDFGLGVNSQEQLFRLYNFNYLRLHQVLSRSVGKSVLLGLGWNLDHHYQIVPNEDNEGPKVTGFTSNTGNTSSGLVVNFLLDNRANANFPESGEAFINLALTQNMKPLGSSSNYRSVYLDSRYYYSPGTIKANVLGLRGMYWGAYGNQIPYFDLPGVQLDFQSSTGRPFIEGRYRGTNFAYLEADYRFRLTKNELFGAAFFINTFSFTEPNETRFSKLLYGYGGSLRIKANRASNLYFLASYGLGSDHARGIFFSLGDIF